MNNNYRESMSAVCLLLKSQTSYSVWSCGVPFFSSMHQESFCFTVPDIIVSGSTGVFSDDSGDAHNVGNKLWVKHLRQHVLKYKGGVSLSQQLQVRCISVIGA